VDYAFSEEFSYKSFLALCVWACRISHIPWYHRNGIQSDWSIVWSIDNSFDYRCSSSK